MAFSDAGQAWNVVTTIDSAEAARTLARELLGLRLAACVQIDAIESLYHWDGQVQQEPEWRLQCKTPARHVQALQQAIVRLHPYDVPQIYALPLQAVHAPYAQWLEEQTRTA